MSEEPFTALQFDRAEPTQAAAGWSCALCSQPLVHQYYDVNGKSLCSDCRLRLETTLKTRPGPAGFLKALVAGVGAGVLGAAIYYAVRAVTGFELSLIAILVGWMVGKAVRWGAQGKGGWAYQTLAVFLTYMSIVSSYVPLILQKFEERSAKSQAATAPADPAGTAKPAAAASPAKPPASPLHRVGSFLFAWLFILGFAAALPFLAGVKNVLGIVIIGIGVWQAWKLNRAPALNVTGPYEIRDRPASAPGTV
ncbi:MAG TPA: hypothetical protein VF173_36960 [Thermoanaerobaculia bacterium]|nr:hypothetical protein [Thermoanaerobaculia bacterium]